MTNFGDAMFVVLTFVLAFAFLGLGVGKLFMAPPLVERADHLGIDHGLFRLIGVPEIAATVGLVGGLAVAPLAVATDLGLLLLLAGALIATARAKATALDFLPACLLLVLVCAHLGAVVPGR